MKMLFPHRTFQKIHHTPRGVLLFTRALAALLLPVLFLMPAPCTGESAETIVRDAFDYWRGEASVSRLTMTIHRPSWQRTVSIDAWTQGESESLFVIKAPAKDRGNGTLKKGRTMWVYNPKVNKIIKLPPSMMSQSWQGSDFSNNDLAKTDSLIYDYTHSLTGQTTQHGHTVYSIRSDPKPDAPVIWGMITLEIRDDHILLKETFFDEELEPVKEMTASDIQPVDGKPFPMTWRMAKTDTQDEYTLMVYDALTFQQELNPNTFTRANLIKVGR
ncbi:outer membrane lipoprotein-sorting protein [Desulfoluna spongiiphila]|uniref:outer membrane lipoprotein-sorting protein n=1 Tax=Desulfoluna spongiiphila TaxID=419481 RepID=UPI001254D60E|nr:outer membrane lipoprotein-sorting protein [Desulfoluna spongiiphila]VVS93010.1 putative outer membrane lipoprotein-sorting protein [Desulfoluna spongiiphila]